MRVTWGPDAAAAAMSKGSRAASRRGKEDFEILGGVAGPARMSRRAVSRVTSTVQVDIALGDRDMERNGMEGEANKAFGLAYPR